MSNPLDVRARIYCNLGDVISGTIEDSSMIDAGLVPTTGRLTLDGMYSINNGEPVDLAYYKGNVLARLGKRLRVITSYANPMTSTTEVQIGCLLAINAEATPPADAVIPSDKDPYNPKNRDTTGKFSGVPNQIRARYIVEYYLAQLKITHDPVPLTSVFTRDDFSTEEPYLKVVSDLIKSETYLAYMDNTERLRFIDLKDNGGRGPLFDETNVIDMRAISPNGDYYKELESPSTLIAPTNIKLNKKVSI